jgi:hypothetical protein
MELRSVTPRKYRSSLSYSDLQSNFSSVALSAMFCLDYKGCIINAHNKTSQRFVTAEPVFITKTGTATLLYHTGNNGDLIFRFYPIISNNYVSHLIAFDRNLVL